MPYETSKSVMRRLFDRRYATTYLVGNGIDVGCGPDPISFYREQFPLMKNVLAWDKDRGDGMLLDGVLDESLDFVHASHSLEHMADPHEALTNWIRVTKPGGHLIIMVPDEDRFEQGVWPSMYSGADHINSWTIGKDESWAPKSISIIEFVRPHLHDIEILKIELLDNTYQYDMPRRDQTRFPINECAIELILRKKTQAEISAKGRIPKSDTSRTFEYTV